MYIFLKIDTILDIIYILLDIVIDDLCYTIFCLERKGYWTVNSRSIANLIRCMNARCNMHVNNFMIVLYASRCETNVSRRTNDASWLFHVSIIVKFLDNASLNIIVNSLLLLLSNIILYKYTWQREHI